MGVFVPPKKQKIYLGLSFLLLFFVSAFRDTSVGTDTEAYEWLFDRVKSGYVLHRQEIAWYYLNMFVITLGGEFNWILIISTFLILFPVFITAKKHSLNPMLSIFLFYAFYIYLQSFNITRQIISVSFAFCFIPFLLNKRWKTYLIGLLVALLFHTSAILGALLLIAKRIPFNKLWWSLTILLSLTFGIILSSILLPKVAGLIGYGHYLERFDSETETGLFLLLTNIFAVFLICTSSKPSGYVQLFFVYIIFYNLVSSVPFAYRLVYFFSIVQLLFLPYYTNNTTLKNKYLAILVILIYAGLFFARSFGAAGVIPYKASFF